MTLEKLRNFVEKQQKLKRNISISTDPLSKDILETLLERNCPLFKTKEKLKLESELTIETTLVSYLDSSQELSKMIMFADNSTSGQCNIIRKTFKSILNPPDESIKDLLAFEVKIESSVIMEKTKQNLKTTNKIEQKIPFETSSSRRKHSNSSMKNEDFSIEITRRTNCSKNVITEDSFKNNNNTVYSHKETVFNSINQREIIAQSAVEELNIFLFEISPNNKKIKAINLNSKGLDSNADSNIQSENYRSEGKRNKSKIDSNISNHKEEINEREDNTYDLTIISIHDIII